MVSVHNLIGSRASAKRGRRWVAAAEEEAGGISLGGNDRGECAQPHRQWSQREAAGSGNRARTKRRGRGVVVAGSDGPRPDPGWRGREEER